MVSGSNVRQKPTFSKTGRGKGVLLINRDLPLHSTSASKSQEGCSQTVSQPPTAHLPGQLHSEVLNATDALQQRMKHHSLLGGAAAIMHTNSL